MAQRPEAIRRALDTLLRPDARGRLRARGVARGMLWRDGKLPAESIAYSPTLTSDLLDYGYGVLVLALELRDANRQPGNAFETNTAFEAAAEALESAVRRGDASDRDRQRHLIVASAAFHLGGYAARSYSLLPREELEGKIASPERALGLLLRRDLSAIRIQIVRWLGDANNGDDRVVARLKDASDTFGVDDAVFVALSAMYYRALARADTALIDGDPAGIELAIQALAATIDAAARSGNIPMWWVATLTRHLFGDLWKNSLHARLSPDPGLSEGWSDLRRDFILQQLSRSPPQIDLWPSQLAAAKRATDTQDDLVIALPTSAGKTRISELCILRALADDKRVVYVTPLRALSAQVERVLARTFVPLNATVTALYGASGATSVDQSDLASANIVVSTPEKLDFALRQDPSLLDDVGLIVFDEGHMIGLGSRELRYEVLVQRLLRRDDAPERRIVCLSAMFNADDPYFTDFAKWLRNDVEGQPVHVRWRPTRQRFATLEWDDAGQRAKLTFLGGEEAYIPRFLESKPPLGRRRTSFPHDDAEFFVSASNAFSRDGHSVLVYSPQRTQIDKLVRTFVDTAKRGYVDGVPKPTAEELEFALTVGREWLGSDHTAVEGLEVGVGMHHGTLPRPFQSAIEALLHRRQLRVVVASPTLAQGVDLSCSVLLFRSLTRFDRESGEQKVIPAAEFANVVGRAGRAFVDLDGITVLPTLKGGRSRSYRNADFRRLIEQASGQQIRSGLAQLVEELVSRICTRLQISPTAFSEYCLNHDDVWENSDWMNSLSDDEPDEETRSLHDYLADLDLALFSLVDPLDAPVDALAEILDQVLASSLWKRTLAHVPGEEANQRSLLRSRAAWIWRKTTPTQRRACFSSGLGHRPGMFLNDRLDDLIVILIHLHNAVLAQDLDGMMDHVTSLVQSIAPEPFFGLSVGPTDWESVLTSWISGTAYSKILSGRGLQEEQKVHSFIQEAVAFRLVWAAEAVRAQAVAQEHFCAEALGDGPALVLTNGVPSIPAALLCQSGFASRTGAVHASRKLGASFVDTEQMRAWLRENEATLDRAEFWETIDQHVLWSAMTPQRSERPRSWARSHHLVKPSWRGRAPAAGTSVRLIAVDRHATVCGIDLTPVGDVTLPFAPIGVMFDAVVEKEAVRFTYFGPQRTSRGH